MQSPHEAKSWVKIISLSLAENRAQWVGGWKNRCVCPFQKLFVCSPTCLSPWQLASASDWWGYWFDPTDHGYEKAALSLSLLWPWTQPAINVFVWPFGCGVKHRGSETSCGQFPPICTTLRIWDLFNWFCIWCCGRLWRLSTSTFGEFCCTSACSMGTRSSGDFIKVCASCRRDPVHTITDFSQNWDFLMHLYVLPTCIYIFKIKKNLGLKNTTKKNLRTR